MKRVLVVAAVVAAAGSIGGYALASTVFYSPPQAIVQYGHIKSITKSGNAYLLKLDPAYWLTGLTAQQAAKEDGAEVDNDYYVVDPDHRLLTYRLPGTTPATVITNAPGGLKSTKVPIAELAQIVKGKNPAHRPLLETGSTRTLGYWVKTSIDTVKSIDQQYQP